MRPISTLLFALLLGISLNLSAQITLESSDVRPAGDTIRKAFLYDLNTFDPGPAGANQSWDFSALADQPITIQQYGEPGNFEWSEFYPDADLTEQFGGISTFYQLDNNGLRDLGFGGELPVLQTTFALAITPSPALRYLEFPLTYQDTYTDTAFFLRGFTVAELGLPIPIFADSVRQTRRTIRTVEVDGHGSLTLPTSSHSDVLRLRITEFYRDSIEVKWNGTWVEEIPGLPDVFENELFDTLNIYHFWEKGTGSELLSAYLDNSNTPDYRGVRYYSENYTVSNRDEALSSSDLQLYPNPTDARVQLIHDAGIAQVRVLNLTGQVLESHALSQPARHITLSLVDYPNGLYLIETQTPDGQTHTERLRVLR